MGDDIDAVLEEVLVDATGATSTAWRPTFGRLRSPGSGGALQVGRGGKLSHLADLRAGLAGAGLAAGAAAGS